jgi:hypothetical protein
MEKSLVFEVRVRAVISLAIDQSDVMTEDQLRDAIVENLFHQLKCPAPPRTT